MARPSGQHPRGISLVEVVIGAGIAAMISLVIAKYASVPARVNLMLGSSIKQDTGLEAMSAPIADLKSAVSTSILWTLIDQSQTNPPYDPGVNSQFIPWFQINDPAIATETLPVSYVCYTYRESSLVRYYIAGSGPAVSSGTLCSPDPADYAVEKVIVSNLLPPTPEAPLFSKDLTAANMVIIRMRFKGSRPDTVQTIIRRVHVRT